MHLHPDDMLEEKLVIGKRKEGSHAKLKSNSKQGIKKSGG